VGDKEKHQGGAQFFLRNGGSNPGSRTECGVGKEEVQQPRSTRGEAGTPLQQSNPPEVGDQPAHDPFQLSSIQYITIYAFLGHIWPICHQERDKRVRKTVNGAEYRYQVGPGAWMRQDREPGELVTKVFSGCALGRTQRCLTKVA
jgi:hypothetical protein